MTSQDLNYYRQRADEELAAAERAGDPSISNIHHEMARRYREMLTAESDRMTGDATVAAPGGGALAPRAAVFG